MYIVREILLKEFISILANLRSLNDCVLVCLSPGSTAVSQQTVLAGQFQQRIENLSNFFMRPKIHPQTDFMPQMCCYQKLHLIHSFAIVHHFIFIECRSVSNSLTSARTRFLVSLCVSPDACYFVYVLFPHISCQTACFHHPIRVILLICSSALAFLLLSFLTFVLFSFTTVVCHLQIEFNLEQIHGECIENFSFWF